MQELARKIAEEEPTLFEGQRIRQVFVKMQTAAPNPLR